MPLEVVVVRRARVPRRPDEPDHISGLDAALRLEPREVRVVDEPVLAVHVDGASAERAMIVLGLSRERCVDRRPLRREDVDALVRPPTRARIPEVVEDVSSVDRTRLERLEHRLLAAPELSVSVVLPAGVDGAASVERVVPSATHQEVAALPAKERVVACSSVDNVVAAAAADHLRAFLRM